MAAALLTHLAEDRIEVRSAGTEPADQINPVASPPWPNWASTSPPPPPRS